MDKVSVRTKFSYGRKLFKPECKLSKLMAELKGTETLTIENINALIDIGYEIEYAGERVKELDEKGAKHVID